MEIRPNQVLHQRLGHIFPHIVIKRAHAHQACCRLRIIVPQKQAFLRQGFLVQGKCLFVFLHAAVIHTQVIQCVSVKNMAAPQHTLHQIQRLPVQAQGFFKLLILAADRRQIIQAVDKIQMLLTHQASADFDCPFTVFHRQIRQPCLFADCRQRQRLQHKIIIFTAALLFNQIQTNFIKIDGFFEIALPVIRPCQRAVDIRQIHS